MNRHAFVIMPYGTKTVRLDTNSGTSQEVPIDFTKVYEDLLYKALTEADCEVQRADYNSIAGDIRTHVLFELVTADIVIADVSTASPNVFYELGIRHGVRPNGTFLVNGDWSSSRPFDIAPDRAFSYNGMLFSPPAMPDRDRKLKDEVERLSAVLKDALRDDNQVESSPVYAQLGGLVPVDWTNIQTSRARYFGGLQDDWMNRVRLAQAQGYPGHILTLAEDAPTRFHREKLLFEAAAALVNMGRFPAAEGILEDLLDLCPDHDDAQLLLGVVLSRLNQIEKAELHMRRIEQRHKDHPEAGEIMGQVYRNMWRLRWIDQPQLVDRQKKAIETSQLAAASIQRYYGAQKCHPDRYFNGFNVLILLAVLEYLSEATQLEAATIDTIDVDELKAVVGFARRCAHEKAVHCHDHVEQFWTLTTGAGLDMLAGNLASASQNFRDACNVPNATVFEFQTIRNRLELLQELGYSGGGVVDEGIRIVDEAVNTRTRRHCQCKGVFIFAGCAVESCPTGSGEFDLGVHGAVQEQIENAVEALHIRPSDLAISGLCHVSDVMFAEACLKRGIRVRLLIPRRQGLPMLVCRGFSSIPDWENRAYKLTRECEVWYQDEHLGRPPEGLSDTERNRRWIASTARMEAPTEGLHALLLGSSNSSCDVKAVEMDVRRSGGQVSWIAIEEPASPAIALAATTSRA